MKKNLCVALILPKLLEEVINGVAHKRLLITMRVILFFLIFMAFSKIAYAFEMEHRVSLTEKYDSNLFLTENDEKSAFSSSIQYEFQVSNETRKLSLEFNSALGYQYYSDNSIDSEYFGQGRILSSYRFDGSDKFKWILENTLLQNEIDSDGAFVPDNLRYENYFLTGPEFNLFLSESLKFNSLLTYGDERIEGEDYYIIRKKGSVSLEEKISENAFLSLNGEIENAQGFDTAESNDRDYPLHQTAYLKYRFNSVSNNYYLAFGITSIDSTSKYYKNIFWQRRLNSHNSFSFEYLSNFNLDENDVGFNDGDRPSDNEGVEYFDNSFVFRYDYLGSEWSSRLELKYEDYDYLDANVYDAQYYGVEIDVNNFITQRLVINYSLDLSESDRSPTNNQQKYSLIGFGLTLRHSRNLTLELNAEHSRRYNAKELNFKNNAIYMTIAYSS